MHPGCLGDGFGSCSGDETAVGEDDMCAEDDFVDTRHQGEDRGVGNHDDGDAGGGEGFGEGFGSKIVFAFAGMSTNNSSVGSFVVVGKGLSVYDRELPFGRRFEEEFLHCGGRGMRENDFVGVDVLEGVVGDPVVHLVELVDDLLDAFYDLRADVFGGVELLEGVRGEGVPGVGGSGAGRGGGGVGVGDRVGKEVEHGCCHRGGVGDGVGDVRGKEGRPVAAFEVVGGKEVVGGARGDWGSGWRGSMAEGAESCKSGLEARSGIEGIAWCVRSAVAVGFAEAADFTISVFFCFFSDDSKNAADNISHCDFSGLGSSQPLTDLLYPLNQPSSVMHFVRRHDTAHKMSCSNSTWS